MIDKDQVLDSDTLLTMSMAIIMLTNIGIILVMIMLCDYLVLHTSNCSHIYSFDHYNKPLR
jgi:hypothetical protein